MNARLLMPAAFDRLDPRKVLRALATVLVVIALASASLSAFAQSSNTFSFMGQVTNKFSPLQKSWYDVIVVYAQRLFWALAAVDFGWTTITYILDKNDISDMLGSLVRKMMTLGFFFALLKFSNQWIPMILDSFTQIGQAAGGASASSTPDGIVSKGYDLALGAFQAIHDLGALDAIAVVIPVGALAILMFLAFLFVAAQLLVTQIESFICIGAGVILLGFGGSRWTTDMASKYMQYAVATGLKLMVLYLIVGAGQSLFSGLTIDPNNLINSCLVNAGSALIYTYLAIQIPAIASAMMSGSPTMTAGGMMGAALTAGAAMAGAGAAVAAGGMSAGKGAAGAAAGATGLAKALSAGINSGLDLGKSGTAAVAHGLGQVGAHGLGMASGSIGDAVGGARTNFAQSVDKSAGGKIASSIESTRGGSVSGIPVPQSNSSGGAPAPQSATGSQSASSAATNAAGSAQPAAGAAPTGSALPEATGHAADLKASSIADGIPGANSADGVPTGTSAPSASQSASTAAPATPGTGSGTSSSDVTANAPAGSAGGIASSAAGSGSASAPVATPTSFATGGSSAAPSAPTPDTSGGASQGASIPSSNTQASAGDASTASVSNDNQAANKTSPSSRDDALHKRIQNLQGYVPQDGAHAASVNIDFKHTQD